MHFAGKVWRLLVGIKDALVLFLVLLFLWGVFTLLTARPNPAAVREGALLLELDGTVVEERTPVDPIAALLSQRAPVGEYQARDLVTALDAAAKDTRIKAVVFDLDRFLGGQQVNLAEIGDAMDRVRAAGKPVLTYATAYADDSLLVASHASEVWINPLGGALVAGPGGKNLYYAGLLDKLKVKAHVYKVGTYKSAVEPYTRTDMSEPARENANALYSSLWDEYKANIARARPQARIAAMTEDPVAQVRAAGGNLAQAAKANGLVDKIGSRPAFERRVQQIVGKDSWSDLPDAYPSTGLEAWLAANPPKVAGARIAVVTIAGTIQDGEAGPGTAGGDRIAALLDDAYADDDLAALVVRVDSPGGSVTASEVIREAIARHKARGIPVAVSMANVAASGGYWVSTASDRIFAEPETITGSIGIFAVIPSFEDTAAMFGVSTDGVRTTPLSGQPDVIGGFTPEVEAIAQAGVENGYRNFIARVAQARRMSPQAVDRVGQGRVWDGGTARQLGLVDQYGGLDDALAWAAKKAGLGDGGWHADFLGQEDSTYETLLRRWLFGESEAAGGAGRDIVARLAAEQQGLVSRVARDVTMLSGKEGVQAYCLECPTRPLVSAQPANEGGWLTGLLVRLLHAD